MSIIQEFEHYVNGRREFLSKSGIKVIVKNAEIRPTLFKLNITAETKESVADFTVWDKDFELPIEADVIVLNIPTGETTLSRSIQPKQGQELIDAFDELTELLK